MKRLKTFIFWNIFIITTILLMVYTYAYFDKLSLNDMKNSISIYDQSNTLMYQSNFKKNMEWTPLTQIPTLIQEAFVSVEDKRFYRHVGFDPIRIIKAIFTNLKNRDVIQGGSTITQQYAKNLFLTNEQTLHRKIQEFFYSARLEMQYSKQEILEGYLNTLYYGHGVYGVKKASDFFFHKPLDALSIEEVAVLIAIPNGPAIYSPFLHPENTDQRKNLVLSVLYHNELIDQQQYETAKQAPLQYASLEDNQEKPRYDEYFIDATIQTLQTLSGFSHDQQLHIYTSYDNDIQNYVQQSIDQFMPKEEELECAAIVVEPFTGHILAISGGKDYTLSQYNRSMYAQRQIASTLKPLLYYTALAQGFHPSSTFLSQATTFQVGNEAYAPQNYNQKYPNRNISMINAIAMSDNIYAIKTHLFLGTNTLHQALLDFGIEQSQETPSLALGTVNMSLLELSKIYNTFASEGLLKEPSFIQKITDKDGNILYEANPDNKRILDRDLTLILNQMLTSTYDLKNKTTSYPTMAGFSPNTTVGVKSGTSDWDSWVIGFNPNYTIGFWTGYDDNRLLTKEYYEVAKQMFQAVFNALYKEGAGPWYQPSNALEVRYVNPISGELNSNGSSYWYLKET